MRFFCRTIVAVLVLISLPVNRAVHNGCECDKREKQLADIDVCPGQQTISQRGIASAEDCCQLCRQKGSVKTHFWTYEPSDGRNDNCWWACI